MPKFYTILPKNIPFGGGGHCLYPVSYAYEFCATTLRPLFSLRLRFPPPSHLILVTPL